MQSEQQLLGLDLSLASEEVIEILLDGSMGDEIFYEVLKANEGRPEVINLLYNHQFAPHEIHEKAASLLQLPVVATKSVITTEEREEIHLQKAESLLLKVQRLKVGEKMLLAMRGDRAIRTLLLRDSNKEVIVRTITSPKITESEIELAAKSRNIPEEVLRQICKKKEWTKNYSILKAIVFNPKTPVGAAVPFVQRLHPSDLKIMVNNKNVSAAVRDIASKILSKKGFH